MNLTERIPRIDRNGLSERVYSTLKEAIMEGKFPPGERLSPEELAKHFEVSITQCAMRSSDLRGMPW